MMSVWVSSPYPAHLDEVTKATYTLLDEDVCDRLDSHNLCIQADISALDLITSLFSTLQSQGLHLCMVVGYHDDAVLRAGVEVAKMNYDHQWVHLYQIFLHELKHGQYHLIHSLQSKINAIDHDDRLTLKTYLDYHGNAILASEALYVHRNTFNYRLNKAIEALGIDVRIHPFGLLVTLYFAYEKLR
jgi:hypothetical protein